MPPKSKYTIRTLALPLAASLSLASILFVYARTSIQAAKRNAERHRAADGGQISWRKESLRRHGALAAPAGAEAGSVVGVVRELVGEVREGRVVGDREEEGEGKGRGGAEMGTEDRVRERARRGS